MAYVYRHIRLDKNEPFYIGIGNDDKGKHSRAYHTDRRASTIWKRIAAKTPYDIEILLDNISWQQAIEKEKEFIMLYGRINMGTGTLANMTDGGQGSVGMLRSKETRYKLGSSWRGKRMSAESSIKKSINGRGKKRSLETRKKISAAKKGVPVSQEMKVHLSKINKGKKLSPETIQKIKLTKSQRTYEYRGRKKSKEEIEKIRKHLWGHKRCLGYKHTAEAKLNMKNASKFKKAVLQYSLDDKFIKEYNSQREAQFETGIAKEAIGRACKSKSHICKKFKWYYKK